MIKFNEIYKINNGQESIVFKQGKENTVTGEYNDGILSGKLEGNLLIATFQNNKTNVVGLIELTFNQNGFNAKWKQGLEPGPMKGKWHGKLSSTPNDASIKEITLGRHLPCDETEYLGSQITVGKIINSKAKQILEALQKRNLDELFTLNEYSEINDIYHKTGIPFCTEHHGLIDLIDNEQKSLPENLNFEMDEYEDFVVKEKNGFVLSEKGFYLITIRFEELYMSKKASIQNENEVKIQPGIDKLPLIGSVLMGDPSFYQLNTFWLNDEPMHDDDSDGNGDIFTTYQMLLFYDGRDLLLEDAYDYDEMIEMIGKQNFVLFSNRKGEPLSIIKCNEDICPISIENDDIDNLNLESKIEYLKEQIK